jgi:hypothetical protein
VTLAEGGRGPNGPRRRLGGHDFVLKYVPPRGDDISEMGEMENGILVSVR